MDLLYFALSVSVVFAASLCTYKVGIRIGRREERKRLLEEASEAHSRAWTQTRWLKGGDAMPLMAAPTELLYYMAEFQRRFHFPDNCAEEAFQFLAERCVDSRSTEKGKK